MSRTCQEELQCPVCGGRQEVKVWASVNVTLDPPLRESVLDGTLNRFHCSSCGAEFGIERDLLYHDMKRHLYIWLKYPDDAGRFGVDPAATALFSALPQAPTVRVVPSYEELVEKILIAEAGLDDLEVELIKFMVSVAQQIDLTQPMFFSHIGSAPPSSRTAVLAVPVGEEVRYIEYPLDRFEEGRERTLAKLRALPPEKDACPYLCRTYVLRLLERAGLGRRLA